MAESQFLKYQDANGDGLIDICEEIIEAPPECPICVPNPCAIVPDWKRRRMWEPFLNEKISMYQITKVTRETTTGYKEGMSESQEAGALEDAYEEYADQVVDALLLYYGKEISDSSKSTIKAALQYTDWALAPRNLSHLKLLYSVPCPVLQYIPDAEPEEDEVDEATDTEVIYYRQDLDIKMLRVRKGLFLYGRYASAFKAIDGKNIQFLDDNVVFDLENYGDYGVGNKSIMAQVIPTLEDFLNTKGYSLDAGLFKDRSKVIGKIVLTFNKIYKLKKIKLYTEQCPLDPVVLLESVQSVLNNTSVFKDQTAMAYFAQLNAMETDLIARTPLGWTEFVTKYTYPEVYISTYPESLYEETGVGACIASALREEGKQLGQDTLDKAFSIADALAYRFHDMLCTTDPEDRRGFLGDDETIRGMAKAQAYLELEEENALFLFLCEWMTGYGMTPSEWLETLNRAKLCGMLDLLAEVIQCLTGGLTFEEAIGTILGSALRAMSIDNFDALFIGLPPEDQERIDALVKEKIETGDVFEDNSDMALASDGVVGNYTGSVGGGGGGAWQWAEFKSAIKESSSEVVQYDYSYSGMSQTSFDTYLEDSRRTLIPSYENGSLIEYATGGPAQQLSSDVVLEAYSQAMLENFKDRELELVEQLNKFPGSQLIAAVIATMACPQPSLMEPSVIDFIDDFEFPWMCGRDLVWPSAAFQFPDFSYLKDLGRVFLEVGRAALQELLVYILKALIKKICEIIGNAVCMALEVTGAAIAAAVSGGRNSLKDAVKEAICGPDADDELVDQTLVEMIGVMGAGAAAFADAEQTIAFTEGLTNVISETELYSALTGAPLSNDATEAIGSLLEFEFPELQASLSSPEKITSLFKNMGNLFPADFRQQLKQYNSTLPQDELRPANPSLCATPEQIEEFCNVRSEILSGRVSEKQMLKLCEPPEDLQDLSDILQKGVENHIACSLPQMISDPGCDNGIFPYESELAIESTTSILSNQIESIKTAFSTDMLGNGPGKRNWGMMNMILSDTMGKPLSAHHRKSAGGWPNRDYVDFYSLDSEEEADAPGKSWRQKGAYPVYVGEWLQEEMNSSIVDLLYNSNNEFLDDTPFPIPLSRYRQNYLDPLDMLRLPDFGYNIEIDTDYQEDVVIFNRKARKRDADMVLSFEDNAMGTKTGPNGGQNGFSSGFSIHFYNADLEKEVSGSSETARNKPGDNSRIKITTYVNQSADTDFSLSQLIAPSIRNTLKRIAKEDEIIVDDSLEFLASDNTFADIDPDTLASYNVFMSTFESSPLENSPPVVLLYQMLKDGGSTITLDQTKNNYNSIMSSFASAIFGAVSDNEAAFDYGAQFDDLTKDEIDYVIDGGYGEGNEPVLYGKAEVADEDGSMRGIINIDQILGISRMEWLIKNGDKEGENRVFYLDPTVFGGNYMRPPLYIKPLSHKGWLGFVEVMFPELSPCKPQKSDLIDFGEIQDLISDMYPNIPDDQRLLQSPDCTLEIPYDRILDRSAIASIQGIIITAIRAYASVHFIKSMASFTKFYPRFTEVYSSLYAAYIIEDMEQAFKNPIGGAFLEGTFKDEEFWYAFLEQSVQMYSRLVESGDIEPNPQTIEACTTINDMQEEYQASVPGESGIFGRGSESSAVLLAVKETEEAAKAVLKELVIEQLNYMGEKFVQNLDVVDMKPDVFDLDYYLLENFAQGGESLNVDQEPETTYPSLPSEPAPEDEEPYYTYGGEFVVGIDSNTSDGFEAGEEYIGHYHVHIDDENNIVYMAGEEHADEGHDTIFPIVSLASVKVGDIAEYDTFTVNTSDTTKPFVVEKYIKINDNLYAPSNAKGIIMTNDNSLNISDVYPGSMELVENDEGDVLGVRGELGVRHGLLFSIIANGTKTTLASAEVDALDTDIGHFEIAGGDSKLLLCLINTLKNDDKFKLVSKYIFPLRKLTAITAIYNDMGFLDSIGEVTVAKGETYQWLDPISAEESYFEGKPGRNVEVTTETDGGATYISDVEVAGTPGWAAKEDRSRGPGGAIFSLEWDDWDKVLLKKTNRLLKRQFRINYNSRKFDMSELSGKGDGPGQGLINRLKETLMPSPGEHLLPWWKRRKLRSNPFNAEGKLCEKED